MGWARSLLEVVFGRRLEAPGAAPSAESVEQRPPRLVDPLTRTFWSQGALAPATLVEAEAPPPGERPVRTVAALLAEHEARRPAGRPRANPAFSEAVFVELMRAGQYGRAFELLSPECQASWGSRERFAASHSDHSMSRVRGVDVKGVRYLDEWTDPDRNTTHREVAELDVEYALAGDAGTVVMPRTVHLVASEGRWRSISYAPPHAAGRAGAPPLS